MFSDVLIIAKCVLAGRRYVAEMAFKLNSFTFSIQITVTEMIFKEKENMVTAVEFEDECLAQIWDKYIQFARSQQIVFKTELKASWTIIHSTIFIKEESMASKGKAAPLSPATIKLVSQI